MRKLLEGTPARRKSRLPALAAEFSIAQTSATKKSRIVDKLPTLPTRKVCHY